MPSSVINQLSRIDEVYDYVCPHVVDATSRATSTMSDIPILMKGVNVFNSFVQSIYASIPFPYTTEITNHIINPISEHGLCPFLSKHSYNASQLVQQYATTPPEITLSTLYNILYIFAIYISMILFLYYIGKIVMIILSHTIYNSIYTNRSKKQQMANSNKKKPVYLLDFALWDKFDTFVGYTADEMQNRLLDLGGTREGAEFTHRVAQNSGLDPNIRHVFPPGITNNPPEINMNAARYESELMMFPVVEELLTRNKLKATDIDVLVVNCSLFNPTPSHCSMIINHFGMNPNIICYALHGMGCSANPIAVNCCIDALRCHSKHKPIGIVVSFENLTQNLYHGTEKGMLVSNALFRSGCAGMLLSTSPSLYINKHYIKPMYKLNELVRVHIGAKDEAYKAIFQEPDSTGLIGVRLSKDIPKIAGIALTRNMTILGNKILPLYVKCMYGIQLMLSKITGKKPGTPNFLSAINHIAIHAGGRGVIDAIEKSLSLPAHITEPSRHVLKQYGNQSSASIWYTFGHIHKNGVKKGEKIWQIAFGSGFKCNSAVWERV